MDLEIINLVKQHGYSVFWLIVGILVLIRLLEWLIKFYYDKIMSKISVVERGLSETEQPTIISNKQILNYIQEVNRKVEESSKYCKDTNEKIVDFCAKSHDSRVETKMLVESIKSNIDEMSHDIQRISDESGNIWKLITERLLNGYRIRQNGSPRDNGES